MTAQFRTAAGIAVATLDAVSPQERKELRVASADLASGPATAQPAFMYVTSRLAEALLRSGTAGGSIAFADSPPDAPARNVVAILPGRDPALRGQLVAIGAHNDHLALAAAPVDHDSLRAFSAVMRPRGVEDTPGTPTAEQQARIRATLDSLRRLRPPRPDSIFNGADDDGSGSVTVLEGCWARTGSRGIPRSRATRSWPSSTWTWSAAAARRTSSAAAPVTSA